MRNRRRRGSAGTARSMGSQLLGLSMFIMLLAFFIVLNAISQYEQTKVHPVMESLGYAFSSKLLSQQMDEQPSMTASSEESVDEGNALDRMKALFTAQIPATQTVVSDSKGEMYVKLQMKDFEAAVMAVGQRNALDQKDKNAILLKGFFLPTLVALMKNEKVGIPYRMDISVNIDGNPAALENSQPQQIAAKIKKLGGLAGKIEDAGLSTKLISVGLQKGEPGTVEILFRRHVPFNPLGDKHDRQQ